MPARRVLTTTLVGLIAAAGACRGSDDGATPTTAPAETTSTAPATTTSTTTRPATTAAPPVTVKPTATCRPVPPTAQPAADRPVIDLDLDVRPGERRVLGRSRVAFSPDRAVDDLVFRLWPNGPRPSSGGARLDVGEVTVDGDVVAGSRPDPTTLVVPVKGGLRPHERVTATLRWVLHLPGAVKDRVSVDSGAIRLGSFYPTLEWVPGQGWNRVPPTAGFAETSVAPTADYTLHVRVPKELSVIASGSPVGEIDGKSTWEAFAVRDVALSIGRFVRARGVAHVPRPVDVVVGVHDGITDAGAYLQKVIASLESHSRRFGPYPWPRYTLAITPGLSGGIEYPMHVMQGPGTLGRTTSHEVAHEWFYGLVGNHQGVDPWLDEGLASYAEALYEGTLGEFTARSMPADAAGHLGEPMTYWDLHSASYYRGVYVQGAQALAAVGDVDEITCALRRYVAANAYAIATPDDLLAALRTVEPRAREVVARYGAVFTGG